MIGQGCSGQAEAYPTSCTLVGLIMRVVFKVWLSLSAIAVYD